MNTRALGAAGEKIAVEYLKKMNYKILTTNFHYSKMAELDIVAKDGDTIVFVEVKTRTTLNYGHPLESVGRKKLMNIFQAGLYYLKQTDEKYRRYRIDVISILNPEAPRIEHLKNVSLN